jgi:hypothetical protein
MKIGSEFRRFLARNEVGAFGVLLIGLVLLKGLSWGLDSPSTNLSGVATSPVLLPRALSFEPQRPVAHDAIKVQVTFESEPSQQIPLNFRWKVNDEVTQESTSPEFQYSTKRGDRVEVSVFIGDNRDEARAFRKSVTVGNSPPSIQRSDERMDENGQYIAHFETSDPDGDPVSLTLQKGPDGMALDAGKGELRWSPSEGTKGTFAVEMLAADSAGAQILYSYSLTLK